MYLPIGDKSPSCVLLSAEVEGWREVKGWKQEKQEGGFDGVGLKRDGKRESVRVREGREEKVKVL